MREGEGGVAVVVGGAVQATQRVADAAAQHTALLHGCGCGGTGALSEHAEGLECSGHVHVWREVLWFTAHVFFMVVVGTNSLD